ncbi:PD-(D/E)XK nuclease family protein [bacterium]|nr:PD-(D/E)XK nuclease family protein [bacterium]
MELYNNVTSSLQSEQSAMLKACALLDWVKRSECRTFSQLLQLSDYCKRIENSFMSSLPFHLNVISAAARGRLKETAHSLILHDLLHHPMVLQSFLREVVEIEGNTFSVNDIEYPDKNRIDLSLHSNQKFLIIENKVNSAEEQLGQVYRYYSIARETHDEENILILYLNPSNNEPPSLYSRSCNGNGGEGDYDTVGIDKITVRNYEHDILCWLYKLSEDSTIQWDEELFLKSAIIQYIDYLEEYFQTKDKYKQLHTMIEKELKEILVIDDSQSREAQIELLCDKKTGLERMMSEINRFLVKLNCEHAVELLEREANELNGKFAGKVNFKMFNLKDPEMGFDVEHGNQRFHVTITYTDKYWWRIYCSSGLEDDLKNHIVRLISANMGEVKHGSKGYWDIYNSTSEENCTLRLSQFAEIFVNAPNFKIC